ncbi:hypothetical protein F511_35028 [Dorcoceras hygrometricum]|uniref:Uncharacterized protein n=1 Tax=Dorcoceras hygrometricum TaxID=472368 RepID=A0A2Z7CYM6_9LAMI|nr:hypothetical protein F511_35028 [Dorcoceras hygrometricum]
MTFRVVKTNQYNQDLGLIHSTNGNHLESPNEGSSIDHQVTIYLHAQNITMFPTNETCSSSDSEEDAKCLMDDDTDEVFDFSNSTFTLEDLVNALNEMVYEYKKLSQTFEDVKAENECLKDKSEDASCLQLDESDSLKTELSKLKTENESLRSTSNELTSENNRLNLLLSSWTKSSISLGKLHEVQKPFNDRTGLGFSSGESSSSNTSTQSYLTDDKLKTMSFIKDSTIHDT